MQTSRRRALWLVLLVIVGPNLGREARAQDRAKEVLVLYSTGRSAPISIAADRELPSILEEGTEQRVNVYAEYLDAGRFFDRGYPGVFTDFLRVKYRGLRFDLVIAIQAAAMEFVADHHEMLFGGTPVVFLAQSPPVRSPASSTGVVAELNLAGTVALASKLHPGLRNVFVVSGASPTDREYERLAREQLRSFEPRLAVTHLAGLPTPELQSRLAALPDRSIVYYLVVYQDGAGQRFSPLDYLQHVSTAARAPTYSWSETTMGQGVVGGSMLTPSVMVRSVGAKALRVLNGEPVDRIPTETVDLHTGEVDWRQLRRWGIDEAMVPDGVAIRFRELSVWDRYGNWIVGAGVLLVGQSALIVGLLVQRARRRQAERRSRESQDQLQKSYDRIRDLGARLLNAQETERARIARELHDDVSQQVALLQIDLELLGRAVEDDAEPLAGETLERAQQIARSVHELSHRLHPAKLELIGLVAALNGLRTELQRPGTTLTFTHENVPAALAPEQTLALFRIAQEAVQNAMKHGGAREVSLSLAGTDGRLTMTIIDSGAGFDTRAAWRKGLGLVSMAERAEANNGTFEIESRPGAGTRIHVSIPVPAEPAGSTG